MRKPKWLKTKLPGQGDFVQVRNTLRDLRLNTVCHEARCPNLGRCWAKGTATIMILGDICTRSCGFCSVSTGTPRGVDPDEPGNVAQAASELGLRYLVVTSVDRDDLDDQGASHFAKTIREVKRKGITIEVLVPDFSDRQDLIKIVIDEKPGVFGHNLETVKRITPEVRDRRSDYEISLNVLKTAKELDKNLLTKTGIMVGLGEEFDEVIDAIKDANRIGVAIFTIGQYLQPTRGQLPVKEYVDPSLFNRYRKVGEQLGLRVVAGPLVRSSYLAETVYKELRGQKEGNPKGE